MPAHNTPASDPMGERMVRVETNMAQLMAANVRTAAFENTVLEALTTIKLRQEDSMNYQKVCDAERDAHEKRLSRGENTLEVLVKKVGDIEKDSEEFGDQVNDLQNSKKVVIAVTSILSGAFAFVATLVANYFHRP